MESFQDGIVPLCGDGALLSLMTDLTQAHYSQSCERNDGSRFLLRFRFSRIAILRLHFRLRFPKTLETRNAISFFVSKSKKMLNIKFCIFKPHFDAVFKTDPLLYTDFMGYKVKISLPD